MELKWRQGGQHTPTISGSNRTFMELKSQTHL